MNLTLKFRRMEKGYKQYELAKIVGITPQYLGMLEKGQAKPSRDLMKRISDTLETSVDDLFFQEIK